MLWQERGGITEEEVVEKMKDLVRIMRAAVETGRKGTEYADRILPCQTLSFEKEMNSGGLVPGDVINKIILYVGFPFLSLPVLHALSIR